MVAAATGRSPYGERGLKCVFDGRIRDDHAVALLTESVD